MCSLQSVICHCYCSGCYFFYSHANCCVVALLDGSQSWYFHLFENQYRSDEDFGRWITISRFKEYLDWLVKLHLHPISDAHLWNSCLDYVADLHLSAASWADLEDFVYSWLPDFELGFRSVLNWIHLLVGDWHCCIHASFQSLHGDYQLTIWSMSFGSLELIPVAC